MKINSKQKSERDLHISQIKKSNFTEMKLSEIKLRVEIKKNKTIMVKTNPCHPSSHQRIMFCLIQQ
jgi:hypothetical protein